MKNHRLNFTYDDHIADSLTRLSAERGENVTAVITEAIRQLATRTWPPVPSGYIRLDRLMDDPEQTCDECDRLLNGSGWMVVYSDHTMRGPVCDSCAANGRKGGRPRLTPNSRGSQM